MVFRADENVKRLFSLEFSPKIKTTQVYVKSMIDEVKRHELDYGSMESECKHILTFTLTFSRNWYLCLFKESSRP